MIVLIALTVGLIVLSIRWYWTKLQVILNLNIPTFHNFLPIVGHGHKLIGLSAEGICKQLNIYLKSCLNNNTYILPPFFYF